MNALSTNDGRLLAVRCFIFGGILAGASKVEKKSELEGY